MKGQRREREDEGAEKGDRVEGALGTSAAIMG